MSSQTMTVLFTDMEGSTEFASARGDEIAMALLRTHDEITRDVAARHFGHVVKSTGDGFLVVFDTCDDAIAAAMEIAGRLREHDSAHSDTALGVRMGLNVGPVIEERGDVYGLAVNAAARVAAKARAGQVLISDAVRTQATGGRFTFVDRGLFWLKGLREQWRLYEVSTGATEPAPAPIEGRTPFVGREQERAQLRERVDRANAGQGGLVLISGDAGVGKTRLAEEIGLEAAAAGMQFLSGRCDERRQGGPYAPLLDMLDTARAGMSSEQFRELVGEHASALARLLPDLRRAGDAPLPAEMSAREERRQLFVAVIETLARLGRARTIVALVDDLHWADATTLRFVEEIAPSLGGSRVLIMGTYLGDEAGAETPLHAMVARLHRQQLVHTVALHDLDRADVGRLLEVVGVGAPPQPVVEMLYDATKGNPFFVESLVRQLSEQGRLRHGATWDDVLAAGLAVPESARFTIESRLAKLRPDTRDVLTSVSLLGRDFGFDLLEALEATSDDALVDAVDEAERAGIIVSTIDGGAVRFAFAHDLIRRVLAGSVSLARAQRLHLRIADALEHAHAEHLEGHAAAIAYHLDAAGHWADRDRTIRFLTMAGDRSVEAATYVDAVRQFDRALDLLPADDLRRRARLLESAGIAERSLGRLDDALARWWAAIAALEALDDWSGAARVCLDAGTQVAQWRGGKDATELVDRGLAALGDRRSPLRAGLLALAGRQASQAGFYQHGNDHLNDALAVARAEGDERVLGLVLYARASHHFAYHEHARAVDAGMDSAEHLRRSGDLWNLANALGYVGASLGWLGRFDQAAEVGTEGEELSRRLGNWSAYVFAEQSKAFRAIGNNPDASALEQRGRDALQLGQEMGFPWLFSLGHSRIGLADFWRGNWEGALGHLDEAARTEVRGAAGGHAGRLSLIHAYLGRRDGALALIESSRPNFPVSGRTNSGTSWLLAASATEAFTILGEREAAAALYPTMVELAETGCFMRSWDYRLVATLVGMSAACAGEWDVAEARFDDALRLARVLPMRSEEPDACLFYARMLRERGGRGDREQAAELRARAIARYDAFAMPRADAMVHAVLGT
jgi:class 3 adenylate cyclase/tetratricopeptide (TPR) repeat protein